MAPPFMQPTGMPLPAPNRIDSLAFQRIDRRHLLRQVAGQRVGVVEQFVGGGNERHQFLQAQGGEAEHRLGGKGRGRFALPVGADAVGAPGRGLVLREGHAVAADLDVVGERQQRVFAERELEDLLRELRRHEKAAVLARGFVAVVARGGGADAADQQAGIDRLAGLVGLIDGLHEFAEGTKAAPGIGFAVVGDDRAEGTLDADARFVGDQGGFAVDGRRGGIDARAQGVEGAHFLVGQVAVLRSGAVGEAAGFLDQGGLASLKLAQVLTHVDSPKAKTRARRVRGAQKNRPEAAWVGDDLGRDCSTNCLRRCPKTELCSKIFLILATSGLPI
jgi:hypothetical protein